MSRAYSGAYSQNKAQITADPVSMVKSQYLRSSQVSQSANSAQMIMIQGYKIAMMIAVNTVAPPCYTVYIAQRGLDENGGEWWILAV